MCRQTCQIFNAHPTDSKTGSKYWETRKQGTSPCKDEIFLGKPLYRTGLPGNELSFHIVPLDPAYKAGLAGHLPVKEGLGVA